MKLASFSTLLAAVLLSFPALVEPNPPYKVEVVQQEPPSELSAAIRKELSDTMYRVTDADGNPWCEIWFRKQLPVAEGFKPTLNIKYPFQSGDLIGALRVPKGSDFEDFRQQIIDPGVYTLRYCLQLEDGNHLGTSETRDFLTLQLADEDTKPDRMDPEEMMELSKNAAMSDHPAILYLMTPPEKPGKLPEMVWDEGHEYAIMTVKARGSGGKQLVLRLIVVGYAEE